MQYPTLDDADIQGKKVLLRAGFDVPIEDGKVTDTTRIDACNESIEEILTRGAKQIIIVAHQGRPKGKVDPTMTQEPVKAVLEQLLSADVTFAKTIEQVRDQSARVILLENIRFEAGEKSKDESERDVLGKKLADLADVYVNDAFSNCHRNHASMTSVPKYIPGCIGRNVQREITGLREAIDDPKLPLTQIISGAKSETKVPIIQLFLDNFEGNTVLVGGCVANTLMVSAGREDMEDSKYDKDFVEEGKQLIADKRVCIPTDVVKNDNNAALDIGPLSVAAYQKVILASKTIVWNGPMGMFEEEEYAGGTKGICDAVIEAGKNGATTILGGGDTLAFLSEYGYDESSFTYVSTAGGAMLDFVSGKKLPALEVLKSS